MLLLLKMSKTSVLSGSAPDQEHCLHQPVGGVLQPGGTLSGVGGQFNAAAANPELLCDRCLRAPTHTS